MLPGIAAETAEDAGDWEWLTRYLQVEIELQAVLKEFPDDLAIIEKAVAGGINAVPGAASGKVMFNAADAEAAAAKGEKVLLVRKETSPEDVGGMQAAKGATGEFTSLLNHISLAIRIINSRVRAAGLAGLLGYTGETNVQGEEVQKLDAFANEVLLNILDRSGHCGVIASEELDEAKLAAESAVRRAEATAQKTELDAKERALKAREAGIKLSVTAILGLAGRERSLNHARETAAWVNRVNPEYFSLLTLFQRHNDEFVQSLDRCSHRELLLEARDLGAHAVVDIL